MAVFIPNVKPEDFNNSYGEKQVYEALRTLNDRYTVFYSLSWVGQDEKRNVGEADFVILHPDKGLMVVEVKSGGIQFKNGEWEQINSRTGVSKWISPFNQARKSQFEILERLKNENLDFPIPMMCYCVWFPSIELEKDIKLPMESPKEIILDSQSVLSPEKAINSAFEFWSRKYRTVKLTDIQNKQVVSKLCPYFHVVPKLKMRVNELEQTYIQLTRQQVSLLEFLEEQKTAVIHGIAGTGKTVLAVEKAKMLASQKESVLFLCYNSFLRDNLRENNTVPNVVFHNIHSLAYEVMGNSSLSADDLVEEFEDYLEVVFDDEMWAYKNIIIDEGQDLDDRLINRLYDIVKRKNGAFYVFYDRNQSVLTEQVPHWIEDAECRLVLHKNCRNTAEVFKTSCSILGMDNVIYNEVHGDIPAIKFYSEPNEAENIVENFIKEVKAEGLGLENIVILSAKTIDKTEIDINKSYAGTRLSTEKEEGKVLFTTIRKFKGLEADAVLIVDASMSGLISNEQKKLLYVGSSRAKSFLNIAMKEDVNTNDMGDYMRNLAPERNVPKNKKGLKRLLNVVV